MKRLMVLLALASIVPAFSVRAQNQITMDGASFKEVLRDSSGRFLNVRAIAITEKGDVFVGALGFPMFRSTDGGDTWKSLDVPENRIFALSVCASGKLYAGFDSKGVAVSSDNGDQWTQLSNGLPDNASVDGLLTYGDTLFANAYGDDLFRSYDGGATWTGLHTPTPFIAGAAKDKQGNLFVAAMGSGVLFSPDTGRTWVYKNNGLPEFKKVSELIVAPDGTLYIGDDYAGTGIHRSTNEGESWERIGDGVVPRYVQTLRIGPDGYLYAGFQGGAYRSKDQGVTWEEIGLRSSDVDAFAWKGKDTLFVGTHDKVWRVIFSGTTGVEMISDAIPSGFTLHQNYPNPFNPSTTIEFTIPDRTFITVKVVNTIGQEVVTLVEEEVSAGVHRTVWNAEGLPSGVYFARLEAKSFVVTKKMVLLR
ncbi:MAG: T9SS type A sorting domain-containing protein [Candidatus Liptonbacteria bacterium]|nr:T9SS type A sorting domain-containing protein [Candidatus Liptonbacteria bacterium]